MKLFLACVGIALVSTVSSSAQPEFGRLTIVAPAAPGGGWDQLARAMQRDLEQQRLASNVVVENVPGAAGTIGLAQFLNTRRGDGQALLVNGLVMLGAIAWNGSPVSIDQATPIARLTGEYEVVAVPSTSPHADMQSLVRALRENAAAVSWGGGSAGGTDHILAGLIVAAAGIDPARTNYIAFSGGGEAVAALLGGQVTAGISGYSEFAPHIRSGRLRALAVSAPARSTAQDVPTLIEQGLDVELENWRAVVGPPGLDPSEREALIALMGRMVRSPSWRATLSTVGWTDSYLAGTAFEQFLDAERARVARIASRLRGEADDSVAARAGEWIFPFGVFVAAAVVLTGIVRSRSALPAGPRPNHGAMVRLAAGLGLFVALLDVAGFVPAGTVLFYCTASAFGSRRRLHDALVGLMFSAAVYAAFTYGLDVALPPGRLVPWTR